MHEIGWWPYQERIKVQDVKVDVLDSRLNLFNARTLVAISLSGEMSGTPGRRPVIRQAHVAEKSIKTGNFVEPEAEIIITPLVGFKKDKTYDGSAIPFSLKQEMILNSMGWGVNRFKIGAGEIVKDIVVFQQK